MHEAEAHGSLRSAQNMCCKADATLLIQVPERNKQPCQHGVVHFSHAHEKCMATLPCCVVIFASIIGHDWLLHCRGRLRAL